MGAIRRPDEQPDLLLQRTHGANAVDAANVSHINCKLGDFEHGGLWGTSELSCYVCMPRHVSTLIVVLGMSSRILFKNLRYRAVLFPEANKKAKTNRFLHSAFSGFQLFSFLTSVTGTREQL